MRSLRQRPMTPSVAATTTTTQRASAARICLSRRISSSKLAATMPKPTPKPRPRRPRSLQISRSAQSGSTAWRAACRTAHPRRKVGSWDRSCRAKRPRSSRLFWSQWSLAKFVQHRCGLATASMFLHSGPQDRGRDFAVRPRPNPDRRLSGRAHMAARGRAIYRAGGGAGADRRV